MLKVVNLEEIKSSKRYKLWQHRSSSTLYISKTEVVKLFEPQQLEFFDNKTNHSLEDRLNMSVKLKNIKGLNVPYKMVESNGRIVGYILPPYIKGIPIGLFAKQEHDLETVALIQSRIDKIIMESHENGVVFPDMCNPGNIIITPKGNVVFIDFDSFQIDDAAIYNYARDLSPLSRLEELNAFDSETNLFTKKADSISAAILCFKNISSGEIGPGLLNPDRIELILDVINVKSKGMSCKIHQIFSQNNEELYIGDNLRELAKNYTFEKISYSSCRRFTRK